MSSFDRMQRLGLDPNLTGDALREALENCKRETLDQIARQTARADIQRRADALGIPAGALDDLSALANELVDIPPMRGQRSGRWEATVPAHGRPALRVMGGQ